MFSDLVLTQNLQGRSTGSLYNQVFQPKLKAISGKGRKLNFSDLLLKTA